MLGTLMPNIEKRNLGEGESNGFNSKASHRFKS